MRPNPTKTGRAVPKARGIAEPSGTGRGGAFKEKSMENIMATLNNYRKNIRLIHNLAELLMLNGNRANEGKLLQLVQIAQEQKIKCENIIDSITDPYIKQIAILRFIKGKTWVNVAHIMGGYATEDCYRKAFTRYIHSVDLAPNGVTA
jgi:hypothetical protein